MASSELYFKNRAKVIRWHQRYRSQAYHEYLTMKARIKASSFPGAIKLLGHEVDKKTRQFFSFLTELNLANLFLSKSVKNLYYEPKGLKDVDFSFDDLLISVKSIQAKDYEKIEHRWIESTAKAGQGKTTFKHKNFSSAFVDVTKTLQGTSGWSRTETSQTGILNSDISEMSPVLRYMGEFEDLEITDDRKKVLFTMVYSENFKHYHIEDIIIWYFGLPNQHPIFQADMNWYYKLFGKPTKKNNIDALVFMIPPDTILSWPKNCLSDVKDGKARIVIYAKNAKLHKQLSSIFS